MTMAVIMEMTKIMARGLSGSTSEEELLVIAAGLPTPFAHIGIFMINLTLPFFISITHFIAAIEDGDALSVLLEDPILLLLLFSTIAVLIFLRRRPLRTLCAIGALFTPYLALVCSIIYGYIIQTDADKKLTDLRLSMLVRRLEGRQS